MKNLLYIFLAFTLFACSDAMLPDPDRNENQEELGVPDMTGEVIRFVSVSHNGSSTRADGDTKDEKYEVDNFEYVGKKASDKFYDFKIAMYKESDSETKIADAYYDIKEHEDNTKADGTLTPSFQDANIPLYWPDNVNSYGFMVTACDKDEVALDQDDPSTLDETSEDITKHAGYNFWTNDKLIGYSYMPGRFDDVDNINFRSNKKWYLHNKNRWAEKKQTPASEDEYKKVPLYLKHQRAWITIILKAGIGVERKTLVYSSTRNNLKGSVIYSKNNAENAQNEFNEITPWRVPGTIEYSAENGLPADNTANNTTVLHAIVEPHDYRSGDGKLEDMIGKIKLSGMTFTYSPSNDGNTTADGHMDAYNLTAGKHLTITASLTTEKIVLISARIEDWEEVTFGSVCDDYGYNGDPIIIQSRDELLAFLQDPDLNKAGNIALISAPTLDLEKSTLADGKAIADVLNADYKPGPEKESNWEPQELKCALNLAGCKISSKGQFLTNISENGSLINGTINITGDRSASSARMTGAVCNENRGIIDHINITVEDDEVYQSTYATQGSVCAVNYGEILYCQSDLQVKGIAGYTGYIGGIAGESKQFSWEDKTDPENPIIKHGTLPIIDHCTMNGRVGATDNSFTGCAGIVGYAENRVTYNTFNYGMTLSQVSGTTEDSHNYIYKNIIASTRDEDDPLCVDAYGNYWPTLDTNEIGKNATDKNTNSNTSASYNNVIDSQAELYKLITVYHTSGNNTKKFRIANDFTIDDTWNKGVARINGTESYELAFELDGNGKTIKTNGQMIFSNITGYFHDFTIECTKSLITATTDNTESIAPLAYSVHGRTARLQNINVTTNEEVKIKAPVPAGLIVWAFDNAKIEDCKIDANLQVTFSDGYNDTDATKYAGGIAALSNIATFSGCHFYGSIKTTYEGNSSKKYRGGIVGGVAISSLEGINDLPNTLIKDCASWWGEEAPLDNPIWSPAGAIVGMTEYSTNDNTNLYNGIDSGCDGNWWSVGNAAGNLTEVEAVQVLGRKNGIQPQRGM